jgi:hypothetical protein
MAGSVSGVCVCGLEVTDLAQMRLDSARCLTPLIREHDPVVLRGYAVGLHWVRELDRGTQRRLTAQAPRLAATVAHLQGRNLLPSLVYVDQTLRLR